MMALTNQYINAGGRSFRHADWQQVTAITSAFTGSQ